MRWLAMGVLQISGKLNRHHVLHLFGAAMPVACCWFFRARGCEGLEATD
jgi:hypothetical protein